jgi:hypothetical protein
MKDRVRIMLGNQEIVKRYIGSRLVWEAVKKTTERLLLKIMQKKSLSSPPLLIIYTTNKNTPAVLTPNKIQADDKQPINLDSPIVNVKADKLVLIFINNTSADLVKNYISNATVIKFYGE